MSSQGSSAPPLASRPRREETVAAGRRGEWTCAPIWAALGPKPWSAPQTLSNNVTFERRPAASHHRLTCMPSVRVHAREMFYGTNNHIGDVRFPLALPTLITVTLSEHAVSCVCVGDFRLCQTVRLAIPQVHCVFRPFSLGRDSTSSTRTQRRTLQRSSARKARRAVTASALALFGRALDCGLRGLQ